MIISQDLEVAETPAEMLEMMQYDYGTAQKRRSKYSYVDVTATLDIETTATKDDGFLYTVQMNIGGQNVLLRYIEDWLDLMDEIVLRLDVSPTHRLVLYVHNLGFEHFFLTQIMNNDWCLAERLFTKPHKPLYIRYENGIELRDSLKLFQKSLAGATKGLPHEKLQGDLDYSVYRTPDTPLTQKEIDYCVNDVQGLYEAIERLKRDHGYNQATIPLTNTAMVIQEINSYIRKDGDTIKAMRELSLTRDQLELAYRCMAGGDTHGTRWRAGIVYENCNSHDEKSAHPSQMILRDFPDGVPISMEDVEEEELEALIDIHHGWIAELFIVNPHIRPECPDPTISVSKCAAIEKKGGVDNGRLLSADAILVYMDSNDWQRFKDAYTYEYAEAKRVVAFHLRPLPQTFRDAIMDKFKIKESYDDCPERVFAKICINTIFGACAQKTVRDEYTLSIDDIINIDSSSWEDRIKEMDDNAVLKSQKTKFPFLWGLWTASLSRLTLWELIKAAGWEKIIYWDTDSVKYIGDPSPEINQYNDKIKALCKERGAVVKNQKGETVYIGQAENEHPMVKYGYKRFTFLHAKCYAAEAWNKKKERYEIETTIAGVGKEQGAAAMKGDIANLKDGLYIADAGGNKLFYMDRPITTRKDFSRPTRTASYIYMENRDYEVSDGIRDTWEAFEGEILAE